MTNPTDVEKLVKRLLGLADCDARSGEPLGKCMREAATMLEAQAAEIALLRATGAALVSKLDECEPHIAAAFLMEQMHGGQYTGPQWDVALAEFRAALTEPSK